MANLSIRVEVTLPNGMQLLRHNLTGEMRYWVNKKPVQYWNYDEKLNSLAINSVNWDPFKPELMDAEFSSDTPPAKDFGNRLDEVAQNILNRNTENPQK